jgi:hypothetical protein
LCTGRWTTGFLVGAAFNTLVGFGGFGGASAFGGMAWMGVGVGLLVALGETLGESLAVQLMWGPVASAPLQPEIRKPRATKQTAHRPVTVPPPRESY